MPAPPLAALLGFLAGLLVNYLSDVLPYYRRPGPPICLHCGERQPPINYFLWPRRCPSCGRRRSIRSWIVELLFILLFTWLAGAAEPLPALSFWTGAAIWIFFGVVAVIDIELRLILHPVSLAGAVLALPLGAYLHGWRDALLGGAAGYAVLLALYGMGIVFIRLTRKLQKDDEVALGYGDVNLAGILGLALGWPNILVGLMFSVLIAGVFSLVLILVTLLLRRYRAFMAIPYGPFLIAGAAILLFLPAFAQDLLVRVGPLFWIGG
ncbi:MAG TPA: A24 family peptidase [Anaerolineales bacterium]|nr:A24 family peptidase [Anaerolineales bacterium]